MTKILWNSTTVYILAVEEIGGGGNATQKALNFKISAQACFVYSLEKQGVSAAFLKCFFSVCFSQCWTLLVLDNGGCTKISFFSVSFGFSLIHSQILGGSIQFFFQQTLCQKIEDIFLAYWIGYYRFFSMYLCMLFLYFIMEE